MERDEKPSVSDTEQDQTVLGRPHTLKVSEVTREGWYFQPNTNKKECNLLPDPDGWFYEKAHDGWRSDTGHLIEPEVLEPNDVVVGPISFARTFNPPQILNLKDTKPQAWKHKETGKIFKFVPWLQPVADSRLDFQALLKDLDVGFTDDVLAEFRCYSGLVLHCGWQFENEHNIWISVPNTVENHFEKLGDWNEYRRTTNNP